MTRLRALGWAGLAAGVVGCASSVQTAPAPTPADIPALEAARQERPQDASVLTRLGIAYYDAKDYQKAADALRATLVVEPNSFAAAVYLGLAYEELGNLDSARVSYTRASRMRISGSQRSELNNRLALLTRRELAHDAQAALARESALARTPPVENTIAVFPLRYRGSNPELQPLERGISYLMVTDLSKVARLQLLERERVQALLDEMQLADSGRVQPATGARSGRLLRAARVVQGSIQEQPQSDRLRLDANVVDATDASIAATGTATDRLQQLFELEKQVVFQLLDRMGITLSAAERRAISERPTADLQAFLAFSRGLEAEDRGDFGTAANEFGAAVARDPNFRSARERQAQNQSMAAAVSTSPAELAGIRTGIPTGPDRNALAEGVTPPRIITLRNIITGAVPSHGGLITSQIPGGNPPVVRPPLPEALQQDDPRTPGLTGTIIIIITRP